MDSLRAAFGHALDKVLADVPEPEQITAFMQAVERISENAPVTRSSEAIYFEATIPQHLRVNAITWERMRAATVIAMDIETSNDDKGSPLGKVISKWGLSFLADITFISVAFSDQQDDGVVIQLPMSDDERAFLTELMSRDDALILFHNGKFDVRGLVGKLRLPLPRNTWDTHAAAITMGVVDLSYTSLAEQCRAYEKVILGDVDYRVEDPDASDYGQLYQNMWTNWHKYGSIKAARGALDALPQDSVAWYVLEDSRLTWKLYTAQREWTEILSKDYGYYELDNIHLVDQRYNWVAMGWSADGYHIDRVHVRSLLERIANERWELEVDFAKMGVGSLATYDGKVRYFFDICGVPKPDPDDDSISFLFTNTGRYAFGKAAQQYYQETFPEETALYTYYQHLTKMEGTFIGYLAHSELDGKGHSTIGMGTITGRSSAKDPNNMNVSVALPEEVESLGRETISARGCIIASPGNVLIELDYSNAEKRAQAVSAQDRKLAEIFVQGRDLHSENAAIFMPREWKHAHAKYDVAVTDEDRAHWKGVIKGIRSKGKPLTFGLDYGMGAKKAARQMRTTVEEASAMMDNFDDAFFMLAKWKRAVQMQAEAAFSDMRDCPNPLFAHGYVENMFGRRILIDDPYWDETELNQRTNWYKGANYIPQSTVADIVKKVIWDVYWYLRENAKNTRIQQQVHDSLIIDADPSEINDLAVGITHIMQKAVPYELSTVGDLYVDWPADLDHADNAVKWGWRANKIYPLPTHDPDGHSIVIGYPIEQTQKELEQEYIATYPDLARHRLERLERLLRVGPGDDWYIYVDEAGTQIEYRRWEDMPTDLRELSRISRLLVQWRTYGQLPQEFVPMSERFRKFVNRMVDGWKKLESDERKFRQWMESHGYTTGNQVGA